MLDWSIDKPLKWVSTNQDLMFIIGSKLLLKPTLIIVLWRKRYLFSDCLFSRRVDYCVINTYYKSMKWPTYLAFVRHDVSAYNQLKITRQANPTYQKFLKYYQDDPDCSKTKILAEELWDIYKLGKGDHETPLANGGAQAKKVGENLKKELELPDVIFVSPYLRTKETLKQLTKGWPELAKVKIVEEERIREQEHGLASLYNDWKIFYSLYPEQRKLHDLEEDYWYRWPQGENVPDVRLRIGSWFNTLVRDYSEQRVLVVSHQLTLLALRANLERLTANQFIELNDKEKPLNAGVSLYRGNPKLGKNGRLELFYYNKKLY